MSGKEQQSLVEIEEDDATYLQITYSQTTCPTYIHAYIHAYIHTTQLVHTQLAHTYSSTHNLLHTNPSPSLFSFLLSPCHLYLSFAACWKKLTCGVIRSFNFFFSGGEGGRRTLLFCVDATTTSSWSSRRGGWVEGRGVPPPNHYYYCAEIIIMNRFRFIIINIISAK